MGTQYKFDPFTGKVSKVGSKATDHSAPLMVSGVEPEKQASLELWAKEQEALEKLRYTVEFALDKSEDWTHLGVIEVPKQEEATP